MKKIFITIFFSIIALGTFAQSNKPRSMHEKLEAGKNSKLNAQKRESHRSVKTGKDDSHHSSTEKRVVVSHSSSKTKKHVSAYKSIIPNASIPK